VRPAIAKFTTGNLRAGGGGARRKKIKISRVAVIVWWVPGIRPVRNNNGRPVVYRLICIPSSGFVFMMCFIGDTCSGKLKVPTSASSRRDSSVSVRRLLNSKGAV
jgi:hypothetical protein